MASRTPQVVGVDVGGTFTDLVLMGPDGVRLAKVPSTLANQAEGVMAALEAAQADLAALDLIVIHGMGVREPGYSEYMTSEIAARIGLGREPDDAHEDTRPDLSIIRTRTYSDGQRELRARELFWSRLIDDFRKTRLGHDTRAPFSNHRVKYNAQLKRDFMNTRVADALIYLGPCGERIRAAARATLLPCLRSAGEVMVVTHSLGGLIAFDTITELSEEGRIAENVHIKLVMLANPLPLLELARPDHVPDHTVPTRSMLEVITLGDPNDILSYAFNDDFKLRHSRHGALAVSFTNARVTIAETAYLGVLVNPITAHTRYYGDGRIIDLITHGWQSPTSPQSSE